MNDDNEASDCNKSHARVSATTIVLASLTFVRCQAEREDDRLHTYMRETNAYLQYLAA